MHKCLAATAACGSALLLAGCGSPPNPPPAWLECPDVELGTPESDQATPPDAATYNAALQTLDATAVKDAMRQLLTTSQECWPADEYNGEASYAGLMIRLAWHCSGSYRNEDGVGGCTGGRMRFEPERSWPDNANLDKARALLAPLKKQFGDALSWGDLFVLAGTEAYRQAGMPVTRMCFGRSDEMNGANSILLGPSPEQEATYPCEVQGACEHPLPTTVGLIYVNPSGPLGQPGNASGSAVEIRRTFETMGHSDRGTVALIGGGHAIGKVHGACPGSPGLSPKDAFAEGQPIYRGTCGTGKGRDTVTSGFEGYWTTTPFTWSNQYFIDLKGKEWEEHTGPGGNVQFREKDGDGSIMRLTTDIALLEDESYAAIVDEFAASQTALNTAFDDAWDRLTTLGNGIWSPNAFCDDGSAPPTTQMRADDVPSEQFLF